MAVLTTLLAPVAAIADDVAAVSRDRSVHNTDTSSPTTSRFSGSGRAALDAHPAWQAVLDGRAVVLMRHALAPGTGDPVDFDLADCSTQRNLSEVGRQQAAAIGQRLRAVGIDEAAVLSSQWCRCQDTARLLGLGEVSVMPALNSFFSDRGRSDGQTQALLSEMQAWVKEADALDEPTSRVLVTHQVNITALTGYWPRSGEMLIVSLTGNEAEVLHALRTE